jgi:solute carrier family 35 protein C2
MFDEILMCFCFIFIFIVLNSGLRWTLSQMVMQKSEMGLANPIDMMYHIQPWMIVTLLPFAMAFEGIYSYDFIT